MTTKNRGGVKNDQKNHTHYTEVARQGPGQKPARAGLCLTK